MRISSSSNSYRAMTDNNHSNAAMKIADKITEQPSRYEQLDKMSVAEILYAINDEDRLVAEAVRKAMPQILNLVEKAEVRMKNGGRIFYVGAGTSGRLGVLDASELPPTFGVSPDLVIGIIAGGDAALRTAVEKAEDIVKKGWEDLLVHQPTPQDVVIGIAASGTTPYVIGAITKARENGLMTGCITSNPHSPLAQVSDCPIETIVGPEFLTGSSRMKSGTAQKMVLNMISTCLMIRMGRVQGNQMVNMQLTNDKLIERGIRMIRASIAISEKEARDLLLKHGSVQKVLESFPT